jgi:hypothetical protein
MSGIWIVRAGEGGYLAKEFARGFVAIALLARRVSIVFESYPHE